MFGWTTDRYVSVAAILIRKTFRSLVFMGVLCYVIFMLVQRIPGGFVPEEDQGYILVNALLPDAASLERTDAVMKKVEKILDEHEAVEGFNTISGFSLLTGAYSSNMGFFFVQLKPWEERHSPELVSFGVINALNRAFAQQIPEGGVIAFGPPAIPGLGTGAGFTMQLQDRSGGVAGVPGAADPALHGGGAQAAGDRPHRLALPRQRAADLRRHRSQQGAAEPACR